MDPSRPFPPPGLSDEDRTEFSLQRMRWCAARAHRDAEAGLVNASDRLQKFLEACSDLSGWEIERELALASQVPPDPAWTLPGLARPA